MSKYFYDTHVHSCLSPCADDDMTPNNIAGMAVLNKLNIVALTDHNTCENCPAFFDACKRQGIIPIPGMELSTAEDIHIICLFLSLEDALLFDSEVKKHLPDIKNKSEIFGNQLVLDGNDEVIRVEEKLLINATDLALESAVELVREHGGVCYPAHIDRESNGIIAILGDLPEEVHFDWVEFNDSENEASYRKKFTSLNEKKVICASDAHYLWNINDDKNFFEIEDEPYSSALVREKFLQMLKNK